jgi:hypothetical protein
MVKKFYLLIAVFLLTSCYTKLNDLTMQKTPYNGEELRIDGYYYSDRWFDRYRNIVVFYRDGFCIRAMLETTDNDILKQIETDILLNEEYINKAKNVPTNIGVFQIMYPDIQFEVWEYRTDPTTYYGTILNDTTFIINKWVNNRTKETKSESLTHRFKQFSPKPDSTNVWIK